MTVDQNEATTNLPSRRAFLTRVALLGVAAVMTFGVAETEASSIAGGGNTSKDIPNDGTITQGEKVRSDETVDRDKVQGAYGYYGHYRRVTRQCTGARTAGRGGTFAAPTGARTTTDG